MKWPSSKASAARNSSRIWSSVIGPPRPSKRAANRPPTLPLQLSRILLFQVLERAGTRAYKAAKFGEPVLAFLSQPKSIGVRMKRIGWAIALAAAALTPAAAQAPQTQTV